MASQKIPITYATMLIGSIAIAGIPPLAGFFSKDEILGEAFKFGFYWVWGIGLFVAFLTGVLHVPAHGPDVLGHVPRPQGGLGPHPRSPRVMTVPLILLAIPSVLLGMALGLPLGDSTIHRWLEPVFHQADEMLPLPHEPYALFGIDGVLILASVTVAAIGVALAWRFFGVDIGRCGCRPPGVVREISAGPACPFLYRASLNKWWFDELNHLLFIVIGGRRRRRSGGSTARSSTAPSTASAARRSAIGRGLRRVQTGRVQNYALGIALGLIVMAGSYLLLAGTPDDLDTIPILTIVTFLPLVGALVVAVLPSRWTRPVALASRWRRGSSR